MGTEWRRERERKRCFVIQMRGRVGAFKQVKIMGRDGLFDFAKKKKKRFRSKKGLERALPILYPSPTTRFSLLLTGLLSQDATVHDFWPTG